MGYESFQAGINTDEGGSVLVAVRGGEVGVPSSPSRQPNGAGTFYFETHLYCCNRPSGGSRRDPTRMRRSRPQKIASRKHSQSQTTAVSRKRAGRQPAGGI